MTRFTEHGAPPPEQPKTIEQYISQELVKQYRAEVGFFVGQRGKKVVR